MGLRSARGPDGGGVGRWIGRSSAAIADQGLFATSNFVLNVLLARWLSPAEYGAFSVVYAGFLLLGTFHSALLIEPLLVFGSGRYADRFRAYLSALVRLHWWMAFAIVGVVAIFGIGLVAAGEPLLASATIVLAPVAPLILFTWLLRRACYPRLEPHWAALAGLGYLAVMLALLKLLSGIDAMSPVSAIGVIGAASLASLVLLLLHLRVPPFGTARGLPDAHSVAREHWDYGRWALGTYVLEWVPTNLFILLLPISGGLEASGSFRALLNLIIPMIHVSTALGILAMPVLVRSGERGIEEHGRLSWRLTLGFAGLGMAYAAILVFFGTPLLDLLYGGRYSEFAPMLTPLALVPVFTAVIAVIGSSLRAVERPDLVFRAYVVATLIAGALGAALTVAMGVAGASYGWVLTQGALVLGLTAVFLAWRRERETA